MESYHFILEKNDQIYHEFLTNPRKASFEGEIGKEVELHGTDNDTNDEGLFFFLPRLS